MSTLWTFRFRSHPADFEILYSALKNVTLEMGITMERTARAPIYLRGPRFLHGHLRRGWQSSHSQRICSHSHLRRALCYQGCS